MKKKLISILLSAVITASLLAGCQGSKEEKAANASLDSSTGCCSTDR